MIGFDVPMGDHKVFINIFLKIILIKTNLLSYFLKPQQKPVLLKFRLPIQKSPTTEQLNIECSTKTIDNTGKQPQKQQQQQNKIVKNEQLEGLENNNLNEVNKLTNSNVDSDRKSNRKNSRKNRRKNSQRKKNDQKQLNISNKIVNSDNSNNSNNSNNKLINANQINANNLILNQNEKNGLNNEVQSQFKMINDNKRLPPLPLRTMSIPELMSNSNEKIKAKRLLLIDKKNFSTSFDQEKIRPNKIHNEEWYLKTKNLFDYSKSFKSGTQQGDELKNELSNELGKLRKDSSNEQYWSSRLTSHHSSSSEEWYRELNDKIRKVEVDNNLSNSVNVILTAHSESKTSEKVNEHNILNELKNELDSKKENKKDELLVDDKENYKLNCENQKIVNQQECLNENANSQCENKSDLDSKLDENSINVSQEKEQMKIDNEVVTINNSVISEAPLNKELKNSNHTNSISESNKEAKESNQTNKETKKSKNKLSKIRKRCSIM